MRRAAIALSAEERMIADGGLWQLEASDERESANPTLGRGRLASRPRLPLSCLHPERLSDWREVRPASGAKLPLSCSHPERSSVWSEVLLANSGGKQVRYESFAKI